MSVVKITGFTHTILSLNGSNFQGTYNLVFCTETIELNQQDIDNKFVTLAQTPLVSSAVSLTIDGGIPQINNVDFKVDGNRISWSELGLDGFLEETDVLIIQY